MKHILVSALLALAGFLLLAGCGGGSGSKARSAHGTAKVTLKIAIPDRILASMKAQSAAQSARVSTVPNKRLIPSNAATINISYQTVDNTGAVVAAPTMTVGIATAQPIPINDLAAGVANTITVTLTDSNAATLASGSTTVNIAPNPVTAITPVTAINITLQSTVTGTVTYTLDGSTVSGTPIISDGLLHTIIVASINNTNATPQAVTTISAANLHVTVSSNLAISGLNANGSIIAANRSFTIRQLKPGPASIAVTYSEPYTANALTSSQNIKTDTLAITLQTVLTAALPVPILQSNATSLTLSNLFDVADNGYALFYDPTLTKASPPAPDANLGYSRIFQYTLNASGPPVLTPSVADSVDFDLQTTPAPPPPPPSRFTGTGSRMTYFGTAGGAATPLWAIVSGGATPGTQVSALPAGTSRYAAATPPTAPAGGWNHQTTGGYTILDLDAKSQYVYLLERNGTAYQIELIRQDTGVTVSVVALSNLAGLAPTRLAVIVLPGETDYYLADGAHTQVAQLRQVGSNLTLNMPFATLGSNVIDIATTNGDTRYVYVLRAAAGLSLVSTLDGTVVLTQPLAGGVTGLNLSAADINPASINPSGVNIYALEQPGAGAQIEGFRLP